MPESPERLSAALADRYEIERELGEGGMATVYLARDVKHNRNVALKVLKPELAAVVGADRFLAEIETTANLQHPHILPLFDSGEADGFLFYVMPYVEGETLRERIDREKQLPVDEALGIATAVANALQTAHDQGVVHRDIKPGNILLSRGEPLVADFGIALAVGAAGGSRLTETGLSVGTPYYMSPEQATGDQTVGPAADTYALACVLYELLVGEPPYLGNTAQAVLGKIIQGIPVSATASRKAVPPNVDAAIRKVLEKLPADRFTGAHDFARALADPGFRYGEETAESMPGGAGWKAAAIVLSVTTLVLATALGWSLTRPDRSVPVERFASPFSSGQAPVSFGPAAFNLSPDGSFLVYRGPADAGGDIRLWVRRWDDLEASPVRSSESGNTPAVSPDGRELAFGQEGVIKVLALEGGPVRTLTDGSWPRWGPDGFIYYLSVSGDAARVPATGGPVETVSSVGVGESAHIVWDFLPDGNGALLHVALEGGFETRALDLRTGEAAPLTPGAGPSYAPSGHLVVWVDGTIMAAAFDPRAREMLGPAVALVDGVLAFTMSRNGKLFYATGGSVPGIEDTELVWMTRSGQATPVESGWVFDRGGANYGWSLSPDGDRIALRRRTEGNQDIWIKELPDGPLRRLTFDAGEQREPFWSPDGRTVAYSHGIVGDRNVWSRSADGTGAAQELLDPELSLAQGSWSPDGEWMVFRVAMLAPNEGLRDVVAWRPGVDSVPRPLIAMPEFAEQGPALSRDGRWLAYTSDETGRDEVFVRPFPDVDSGKWQVSTEGGLAPRWSHGGGELYYVDGSRGLVAATVETSPAFRVVSQGRLFPIPDGYLVDANANFYDVAPGDDRFLMGRQSAGAEGGESAAPSVILVQNFFEELRRRVGRP